MSLPCACALSFPSHHSSFLGFSTIEFSKSSLRFLSHSFTVHRDDSIGSPRWIFASLCDCVIRFDLFNHWRSLSVSVMTRTDLNRFFLSLSLWFRGRFSAVKKCVKKDSPDQIFAAKIIKKRNVQHALNELRIFQMSHKHPNFVLLYQVFDLPTEAIFVLE